MCRSYQPRSFTISIDRMGPNTCNGTCHLLRQWTKHGWIIIYVYESNRHMEQGKTIITQYYYVLLDWLNFEIKPRLKFFSHCSIGDIWYYKLTKNYNRKIIVFSTKIQFTLIQILTYFLNHRKILFSLTLKQFTSLSASSSHATAPQIL